MCNCPADYCRCSIHRCYDAAIDEAKRLTAVTDDLHRLLAERETMIAFLREGRWTADKRLDDMTAARDASVADALKLRQAKRVLAMSLADATEKIDDLNTTLTGFRVVHQRQADTIQNQRHQIEGLSIKVANLSSKKEESDYMKETATELLERNAQLTERNEAQEQTINHYREALRDVRERMQYAISKLP